MGNNNDINHADTANNNNPHSIPSGRWRDGLCDCCTLGCCHTHACMAYWCCACTLGQIMTRMNLTWLARPHVTHTPKWSTFRIFFLAFAIFLTFSYSVILATFPSVDANGVVAVKPGDQFWKTLSNVASLSWCIFMLVTLCKTRAHVRRTYGIPETTCRGCEDCCCAYWCGCCTVAQMARHTVDYRQYEAGCCTSTGMRPDAPATCPYNV